jgi:transcriptional regulator with XRE-family HTH domain
LGGNTSEIARLLGVSSQLLGQYARGRHKPKPDFYLKWKEVFGEDLLSETIVSKNGPDILGPKPMASLESGSESDLIQVLLNSYEKQLRDKERLIEEKESRLRELEDHKRDWKEQNKELLQLLNSGLQDIKAGQHVSVAYQMFWIDKWAEKEAEGDTHKAKQLAKAFHKAVGDKLKGKKQMSNP